MITIPLTKGQVTVIDDEDAELCRWRWSATACPKYGNGGAHIARRGASINGKPRQYTLHREIMARMLGRELNRSELVDHIDCDTLNNRRSNLRIATGTQNNCNQRIRKDNKSGYKGVHKRSDSKKWRAQIHMNGVKQGLGVFDTPEEAARAYDDAARQLYGEFACLNFPTEGEQGALNVSNK